MTCLLFALHFVLSCFAVIPEQERVAIPPMRMARLTASAIKNAIDRWCPSERWGGDYFNSVIFCNYTVYSIHSLSWSWSESESEPPSFSHKSCHAVQLLIRSALCKLAKWVVKILLSDGAAANHLLKKHQACWHFTPNEMAGICLIVLNSISLLRQYALCAASCLVSSRQSRSCRNDPIV